jgi:hypothetical protein
MSSQRQRILDNLAARLLLIQPGHIFTLPSGPYECQSTINKVQPWRKNPYSLGELPAIAWRDAVAKMDSTDFGLTSGYKLTVAMAVYQAGTTAAAVARQALADMVAAIGSDTRFNGLAVLTRMLKTEFEMTQGGDISAAARLWIEIAYIPSYQPDETHGERELTSDGETLTSDGTTLEW